MKIVFHNDFYNSDYSNDGAAAPGRIESIMEKLSEEKQYSIIQPQPASLEDLKIVHNEEYISKIRQEAKLYQMATLSAGGAILAARTGLTGEPSFACIRPPGHHAHRSESWGYCYFSNMAIALKKLRAENLIQSAFVLDFDAHTGDGTISCLSDWKEVKILNPMADDSKKYMKLIEEYFRTLDYVDIIAVCAGFDSYEKDVGRKLSTFDFYVIGAHVKLLARRFGHNRRFAILEGGYYIPDLGKNVLAFCQGMQ